MNISFEDTEHAFAYKSNKELKRANFLFSSMQYGWLVKLGTRLTPWAITAGLPIRGLIRQTIFKQFVGGETLEETSKVADTLEKFNVKVILDYGVEGKEGEDNFEHAADEFIRVIQYAGTQHNIPFMSIKLTGLARFALLEKLDAAAGDRTALEGRIEKQVLNDEELAEWTRVEQRLYRVCNIAAECNIGVLIDAEDSWVQDPVDALTMKMMERFNKEKVIVYNTYQLYRHDRLAFLKNSLNEAINKNFLLGAKLVRGAYMEKERNRAIENNYPSPIQPDKESTDRDYNQAVEFCINHFNHCFLIVASHNDFSNLNAVNLLEKNNFPLTHRHIHFSQLYGMSDNITFNLAAAGCSVSKYLPFGPLKDVVPYMMRRAQENSSVKGQTGREVALIKKEMKRRGI